MSNLFNLDSKLSREHQLKQHNTIIACNSSNFEISSFLTFNGARTRTNGKTQFIREAVEITDIKSKEKLYILKEELVDFALKNGIKNANLTSNKNLRVMSIDDKPFSERFIFEVDSRGLLSAPLKISSEFYFNQNNSSNKMLSFLKNKINKGARIVKKIRTREHAENKLINAEINIKKSKIENPYLKKRSK